MGNTENKSNPGLFFHKYMFLNILQFIAPFYTSDKNAEWKQQNGVNLFMKYYFLPILTSPKSDSEKMKGRAEKADTLS